MPAPALTSREARVANLQHELLDLFATDLSDDDLREVRHLLARHFAGKATAAFDRFADAQGLTPEDTDRWAFGHERARTNRSAAGDGA